MQLLDSILGARGGPIEIAESAAAITNVAPDSAGWVVVAEDTLLQCAFTAWTAGDVLVVHVNATGTGDADPGREVTFSLLPQISIDGGSSWHAASPNSGTAQAINHTLHGAATVYGTCALPLSTAPLVQLQMTNNGDAGLGPNIAPLVLRCERWAAKAWTQGPGGVLV